MSFFGLIDKTIQEKVENAQFSGVVSIVKSGKDDLFSGAYGYANRTWKVENEMTTRFRIASISKMFTAVSILQLIESGKISFNTKAVDLLSLEGSEIPKEVTVESLLTHTSGIGDYYDEALGSEAWDELWSGVPIYKVRKLEDYLPLFLYKAPVYEVGDKYHYNGAGYILLGLIIEKASGLSYFDYVRENIFRKIGMNDSDFLSLDGVEPLVAEGYEARYGEDKKVIGWVKNIYTTTPDAASDGGATSSVADLLKFMQALRRNELLSIEMTEKIFTPVVREYEDTPRGYVWMYGYGIEFLLDKESGKIVRYGHTGEEYGVSCRLYYYPDVDVDVVILGNQGWCAGSVGWSIHDVIKGTGPMVFF